MENTIENARKFLEPNPDDQNRPHWSVAVTDYMEKKLVAYASQITQTPLEQRQATRTKIAEVLDREYETRPPIRIVVPSDEDILEVYPIEDDNVVSYQNGLSRVAAKWMLRKIRTLNPGAELLEADKNEMK